MKSFSIISILLVFLVSNQCFSQSSEVIKKKISHANLKKKADLYLDLGLQVYYETGSPDSLLKYTLLSLQLAKKTKDIRTEINAYKFSSTAYAFLNDFEKSNLQLDEALKLSKRINHKMNIADVYNKYGYNYQLQNKPEKAIKAYISASSKFEEINEYDELIISYQNITSIFSELNQPKQTKYYLDKMVLLLPKIKDTFQICSSYSAIADRYCYLFEKTGKYEDLTLKYTQKGIRESIRYKIYNELGELYNTLGNFYFFKEKFQKSKSQFIKTLNYSDFINDGVKSEAYFGLFDCYKKSKDWFKAGIILDSLEKLTFIQSYNSLKLRQLKCIYEYAKNTKKTELALKSLEELKQIEDSTLNLEKSAKITELEEKYNRVKNETTILKLSRERKIDEQKANIQSLKINQLIIGLLLLLLILSIIIYLYYQSTQKRKRKIIEVEQRLNRARMDPHFVFNVLAAVQALQMDPLRKDEASNYLTRISKLMRLTLESTYIELTSLEDEIDFLKEYIELQKLLKNNCFSYSFQIDDKIDPFDSQIPSMILQPFIENAIEHGVAGAPNNGFIEIRIDKKQQEFQISIFDNGKGVKNISFERKYPSRATSIVKDRLSILKDSYKKNARFETNLKENGGYEVVITLPIL